MIDLSIWRESMLTLPDPVFYDLMHNYLGDIPSPHNRQELVDKLSRLLGKNDFQDAMQSGLSDNDLEILLSVQRFGSSNLDELFSVLQGGPAAPNKLQLQNSILLLQDRLWLYKPPRTVEYRITPHIMSKLGTRNAQDHPRLGSKADGPAPHSWLGDPFIAALAGSWQEIAPLVKGDGKLSKRSDAVFQRLFAGLGDYEAILNEDLELFTLSIAALYRLGIVVPSLPKKQALLCLQRLNSLSALPPLDRLFLFAGAALFPSPKLLERHEDTATPELNFQSQGFLHRFAQVLRAFYLELNVHYKYLPAELSRVWQSAVRSVAIPPGMPTPDQHFFARCATLGLLWTVPEGDGRYRVCDIDWTRNTQSQLVQLASGGEVRVKPEVALSALLPLLQTFQLTRFGRESTYKLDMPRMRAAFERGMRVDDLFAIFGGEAAVPPAVLYEIKEANTRAQSARLHAGHLLELDAAHQALGESLLSPEPTVCNLGNGRWFIAAGHEALLQKLADLGLLSEQALARMRGEALDFELPDCLPPFQVLPPPPEHTVSSSDHDPAQVPRELPTEPERENPNLQASLMAMIEASAWDNNAKNEARQRVVAGLIFHPAQLECKPRLSEKGRAQGLDFTGKIRLLEEAIKSRNERVELKLLGADQEGPLVVVPKQLKGTAADTMLLAIGIREHKEMLLYVRKIIDVRRIQMSFHIA